MTKHLWTIIICSNMTNLRKKSLVLSALEMQTSITMFKRRRMNHNAKLKYNVYLSGHANTNQHVIIGRNAKKDGYVDTILCVKANGIAEKIGDAYRYIQYGAEIYGMKCQTKFECQKKPPHEKWKCPHKKSQAMFQQPVHQYIDEWKCRHQCEDLRECLRKWECPHEFEYINEKRKCKDKWKCRTRWWHCQHTQPCNGKWQCLSDPNYRNKWQCQNKLTISYSQGELKACLKKTLQPNQLYDFFTRQCNECEKKGLITSFLLYTGSTKTFKREIICHLVWAKAKGDVFYRVF
ncbi:6452_t:CDS:2, partial [Gigaspora rosea]